MFQPLNPRVSPRLQRLVLRLLFGTSVLIWSLTGEAIANARFVSILAISFGAWATMVFFLERGRDGSESQLFIYCDIVFTGILISLTGKIESEFHLLFYFIIAMRAPYTSWFQTLTIPGVCTLIYLPSVGSDGVLNHWFNFMVRIGLLWFLPVLLRFIGTRSILEKERAERLSGELVRTHDEVRRYTAALEKTNVEKERQLEAITVLHHFVMEMRAIEDFEDVYRTVFAFAHKVSDAPWVFLVHTRGSGKENVLHRSWGDPSPPVVDWVRDRAAGDAGAHDGIRLQEEIEGVGDTIFRSFRCEREQDASLAMYLAFPPGHSDLLEGQIEVLSALMDAFELELEVLRLREGLTEANRDLTESNRHLTRLHELQYELSHASLIKGDISEIIHSIQEIMANELFELDRLNLFLPNRDTQMLECMTSVGIEDYPVEKIKIPLDHRGGAISKAYREGKTIFFNGQENVPVDLRLAHPYSEIPAIRSRIFVIVPILDYSGRVLGVIGADRKYTHLPIPDSTVTMLEFFARHVAMVLSYQEMREGVH
ncbi:GAF domain-containing protein [bacterium]|nr:MAG: GAF domain-containing protein [bacterium]